MKINLQPFPKEAQASLRDYLRRPEFTLLLEAVDSLAFQADVKHVVALTEAKGQYPNYLDAAAGHRAQANEIRAASELLKKLRNQEAFHTATATP